MRPLRPVRDGDALGLLALERALLADGRGMVKPLDDLPDDPTRMQRVVLESLALPAWRGVRLVQEDDQGRLISEGSLARFGPSLLDHGAVLALGVHPDHQGKGLGRAMVTALLDWATDPPAAPDGTRRPLHRVELYVRADNPRAIGLYTSLGFAVEGRRRGFVRLPDGTLVDDLVMARLLA